ncbi:hypothetical protein EVC20_164 [Rhizobium phage RHph_Y2_17_1]|nr:hypothetical protein EVC19_164 [Rhizobium phage RHph_Y2_11]QIG75903.1 hypothetical protein EVC20_164 [Rhizobium phage RHph_Y2_17_1]
MTNPKYFVLNEHTLGYTIEETPGWFGILHASILKGSTYDRLSGPVPISPSDTLRPATKADFDEYRVSWKGHLPEELS